MASGTRFCFPGSGSGMWRSVRGSSQKKAGLGTSRLNVGHPVVRPGFFHGAQNKSLMQRDGGKPVGGCRARLFFRKGVKEK